MLRDLCLRFFMLVVGITAFGYVAAVRAQTPVEFSAEARFQLDLHVADAALAAMLPAGFTPNVATQGAAKDCNLRAIFVDRMTINGPDGKTAKLPRGGEARYILPVDSIIAVDPGSKVKAGDIIARISMESACGNFPPSVIFNYT